MATRICKHLLLYVKRNIKLLTVSCLLLRRAKDVMDGGAYAVTGDWDV